MPRPPFTRRYGTTFYFFPAFLPLVELLPWFLTALGAMAGATNLVSKFMWRRKRLSIVALLVCMGCFAIVGGLVWQRTAHRPTPTIGSELSKTLPMLKTFSTQQQKPRPPQGAPLTPLWSTMTTHHNLGAPLVHAGVLFVGTWEGTLDAFDTADGHLLWSVQKHEPVFTAAAIAGGRIFIGEGYHTSPICELTALSLATGTPLWSRRFRSHLESYPVVDAAHNRLWYAGGATGLWALAADTGEQLWWQQLGHMDVPPLYRDGRLFAIAKLQEDADGTAVFALNPDDGTIQWKTPLEGNTMGSLWAHGDRIYLSTAMGQVGVSKPTDGGWAYALNTAGDIVWKTKLPAMPLPEGALARDGAFLLYTLKNGDVIALNTGNGTIAWQEKIGTEIETDITLIEDRSPPLIAAIAHDGNASIRDMATGQEYAHFPVEPGDSNPLYADGILYITTPTTVRAYAGFGGR